MCCYSILWSTASVSGEFAREKSEGNAINQIRGRRVAFKFAERLRHTNIHYCQLYI